MAIAEITMALGAIKTTTEVVTAVLKADKGLSEAELKLRLAEAANTLLDARMAVLDAQTAIEQRDAEIARLAEALENKSNVVRHRSAYYDVDEHGKPFGDGYCMRCYEVEHKLRHLSYGRGMVDSEVTCPACKSKYVYAATRPIQKGERAMEP